MTIYQPDNSPFFYIIQDTINGIYYAGSRWAKNASVTTFMTRSGYKTSSKIVKQLIEESGLGRFTIRKIKLFETEESVRDYETKFLIKVDAKNNPKFYNLSNGIDMSLDSEIVREKMKKTNLERYGYESSLGCKEIREKIKETNLERYGSISPLGNGEIREIIKNTNLERYGEDNPSKNVKVKEKRKNTFIENYGVDHPSKTIEVKEKISKSNREYYRKNPHHRLGQTLKDETKEKLRQANLGKTHSDESKIKMSEKRKNKIWIKKDGQSKHINKNDYEHYCDLGWEKGRILGSPKNKKPPITEQQRNNLKNILSRRRWIKKDGEKSKHVDENDLDYYLANGWELGRNR